MQQELEAARRERNEAVAGAQEAQRLADQQVAEAQAQVAEMQAEVDKQTALASDFAEQLNDERYQQANQLETQLQQLEAKLTDQFQHERDKALRFADEQAQEEREQAKATIMRLRQEAETNANLLEEIQRERDSLDKECADLRNRNNALQRDVQRGEQHGADAQTLTQVGKRLKSETKRATLEFPPPKVPMLVFLTFCCCTPGARCACR